MSVTPVPKYTATIKITANSHEELDDRIQSLAVNWGHHHTQGWSRDSIDSTDGTTTVRLEHTNPEQTPEAYRAELRAWADERRRHDPTVMSGGRSAWATCSCGWRSGTYRTTEAASSAWAAHIAADTTPTPAPRLREPEPESEQEAGT